MWRPRLFLTIYIVYTTVLTNGKRSRMSSSSMSNSTIRSPTNHNNAQISSTTDGMRARVRSVPHIEGNWATHISIRGNRRYRSAHQSFVLSSITLLPCWTFRVTDCTALVCISPTPTSLYTHMYVCTQTVPNTESMRELTQVCVDKGRQRLRRGMDKLSSSTFSDDDVEVNDQSPEAWQHISLSRTLYLRLHHITPFVADLKKALAWATR